MKVCAVFLLGCAAYGLAWPGWAQTQISIPAPTPAATAVNAQPVDVLHWLTSASERRAANQLSAILAANGVQWRDAAIPGGGGMAAVKVLKSRVLMGDAPDVAQLIGTTLTEWADVGLVLSLNAVATRQRWAQTLFPTVMDLVSYNGTVIAAPLGIHRINTLLYNRRVFARIGLPPPHHLGCVRSGRAQARCAGHPAAGLER